MWNGEKIREFREKRKWSQKQLAEFLRVKVRTIRAWEKGERNIPGPVTKLLELLDIWDEWLNKNGESP